jgi:HEAT repeat protein
VQLQLLILIVLAVAATIFSVVTSFAMVVRKALELGRSRVATRLYKVYAGQIAEYLLLELNKPLDDPRPSAVYRQYESLLLPLKQSLANMTGRRRRFHRAVLRSVLIDMTQDLSGESGDRLVYVFYSLGFVDETLKLFKSHKWWIRAQAARDAGLMRARKSIAALTAALEDHHAGVRNQAMEALIVLVGVDALRTILRLSRNISQWTAIELSAIVGRFREEAVPHLIEALESRDQSVVLFATEMLGRIGFVTAVEPLMSLIRRTGDTRIQATAAATLGRLGDERAKPLLVELLANRPTSVRMSALAALGRTGGPDVLEILVPYLASTRWEEKLTAARAVATTGLAGIRVLQERERQQEGSDADLYRQVLEEFGLEASHA